MVQGNSSIADIMYSCAAASLAAFLCPQDFLFVLILRGALKSMLSIDSLKLSSGIDMIEFNTGQEVFS